jgi:hypothetical protein
VRGEGERGRGGEREKRERGREGEKGEGETRRQGDKGKEVRRGWRCAKSNHCQYAFNRGYESIVVYLMPLIVLPHNYVFHETTIFKPLQHL